MITILLLLAAAAALVKAYQTARRLGDFDTRFTLMEQRLDSLEQRLGNLQTAMRSAPVEPVRAEKPPVVEAVPPPLPPPAIEVPPLQPQPAPQPAIPQPPRPSFAWKLPRFDWESLVGVKLFSCIAGVALLLAAVFFLRYSITQGWLMPQVRMAIGIVVGIGLLVLCELKAARKYPATANAMDASAIAILFSTFFAARSLWNLIGALPAFALMVLVTAVAVMQSIRRNSIFIALLGLVGGFATPALLSTGENRPVSLFTYLLLLNAGLARVAVRKQWPLLTTLSLVFTVAYQWGWVMKSLTAPQLPVALGIFLAFPILAFIPLAAGRREAPGKSWISLYGQTANLSALFPLLFALYMAAVPAYGQRCGLLFGFLLLLDAGLFAIAAARRQEMLHFFGAVSTILVFAIWLGFSYNSGAWPEVLAFLLLFAIFYLAAPLLARRFGRSFAGIARNAVYAAPLLLFALPCLAVMEPSCAHPSLLFGTLFLILLGASAYAVFAEEGALYYIAALFALLTECAWSVRYLAPERLYSGLAIYAVFGLFFIGVPAAARWRGKSLRPESAGAVLLQGNGIFLGLAGHIFLVAVAAQKSLCIPPWPLLGILLVLDLAIGAAALYARRSDLHRAAMAGSAVILAVWAGAAGAAPWPATAVVAAGVLTLFGFVWIRLAKLAGIEERPFVRTAAVTVILAQFVAIFAAAQSGTPGIAFLLPAHLVFLTALLALEWFRGEYAFAVIALIPAAIAVSDWCARHPGSEFWPQQLLFAAPVYLLFAGYPLLLGRRCGKSLAPCLAAVLANIPFFFQARHAIIQAGWGGAIGILPVAQAVVLALLLMRLLSIEPPGERALGRLALVAGAALAFITVAIPLQLEKEWITVGWALEGAALAWLYRKIPHRGLLYFSAGLFAAVFSRLALNPSILTYQLRSGIRIWNWYLYTYLVSAAALIAGGRLLSKTKDDIVLPALRVSRLLPAGGVLLLFLLLNIEIADFYSAGTTITFNFTATLAQDLTYTLGWAAFALALLAAGILARSQPARIASLALLVITILKCFVHDLARLGGLYRVASFVGLAICLALVALVLQKFVLAARKEG